MTLVAKGLKSAREITRKCRRSVGSESKFALNIN